MPHDARDIFYRFRRFMSGSPAEDLRAVRDGFWPAVRRTARRVPFVPDLVAAYYCAMDPATPFRVKATLLAALAYFVLPADLVPDLLPLIGFGDDAAVLMTALGMVAAHVTDAHRQQAREALAEIIDAEVIR
jgi:uncharacterized membrane protein YkvA (DUF1232 family)